MAIVSVTIKVDSEVLDAIREGRATNRVAVKACIVNAARPKLVGKYRRAEKAKVDLKARVAAERTIRDTEAALEAAEAKADADANEKLEA